MNTEAAVTTHFGIVPEPVKKEQVPFIRITRKTLKKRKKGGKPTK